ncbi:MAG TPA: nucleotide exchange factor GrpE [Rhizomicrobium sp.]|nr:nucleotide exchange factor GrpE [Rhizomicrobium sp.]
MNGNEEDYVPESQANGSGDEAGREELAALRDEVAELKDRYMRALADVENTRRRAEREKTDASQYAVTKFARDVLSVADNLKRALDAYPPDARAGAPTQVKAVIEGIEATERHLISTLERHGVKLIDTTDARFDPHLHQAIAEVPAEGKPPGSIVNVVQTGYLIADRLLRPAMVTIARNGGQPSAPPSQDDKPGSTVDTKA